MAEFRQVANTIALLCFSVALGVYVLADRYLAHLFTSSTSPIVPVVVFTLSSLGVFSGVFTFLLWFYQRFLHVRIFRIYDLAGEWYHVGTIEESGLVRYGEVHVDSDIDGIRMSGTNYREDGKLSSHWQSEAVAIVDRKLVVLYVSDGIARTHPMTRGAMITAMSGMPCVRMSGVWNDTAPFTNRGTVTIFRNQEEYKRHLTLVLEQASNGTADAQRRRPGGSGSEP